MDPQATAGRIVHYHIPGGQKRAAIVGADTSPDGTACLTVFYDGGPRVTFAVPYSEEPKDGCWSWMPYQHQKAQTDRGNESESAVDIEPEADSSDIPEKADGEADPGAGVSAHPLGGPTAGVEEAGGAERTTEEPAVVDGEPAEVDGSAEVPGPSKPAKGKKK